MRLTAFLLLAACVQVNARGYGQAITLSEKNAPLEKVFSSIQKQTGYSFWYYEEQLVDARKVDIAVKDGALEDVLRLLFRDQPLTYSIVGRTVVVKTKEKELDKPVVPPALPADTTIVLKGRVADYRGTMVENASVVLRRTGVGTETDISGAFALKIKSLQPNDTLVVSFIGLKTRYLRVGGKTNLGVVLLQLTDNALDEAMVTAYGTTSQRYKTGDITTIKAEDIEKTPATNVIEALAGRVPGLYIRQNGSNPSSVYDIQLRGINALPPSPSMTGSGTENLLSKPLIVIDGLPVAQGTLLEGSSGGDLGVNGITGLYGAGGGQDPLYWLNTLDIESISVLKDAEATSLYGSRAANGVILITTKKGKPGKSTITVTANTGINIQARRLKLMNTQQYLAMRHEAWVNTTRAGLTVQGGFFNTSTTPNAINSYDLFTWDTTRYTDWQKVLLGSAPNYNANLELSGGESRTTYRVSAGYNRSGNSYPGIQGKPSFKDEKASLAMTISTHSLNNRFKLSSSVMGSLMSSNQPPIDPGAYIFMAPDAPPIFDARGNLNFVDWRPASPYASLISGNPFFALAGIYTGKGLTLQARTTLSYELLKSLVFSLGAAYSRGDNNQFAAVPGASQDPLLTSFSRSSNFGSSTSSGLNFEPNLNYSKRLGRSSFNILVGGSYQADKAEGTQIVASGYSSDQLMGTVAGATSYSLYSSYVERKSISALAQISYHYADKYLLDLGGRRDGSSSFGSGHQFGNFGSIGLGWIFTEEPWLKHLPLLSFGKLRGSYGITGSPAGIAYTYLSTFKPAVTSVSNNGNGVYQGVPALSITRIANPNLAWSQARSLDLGLDLGFLPDQRIRLGVEWYRKRVGNQITTSQVSTITGTSNYMINFPAVIENSGWEGNLQYNSDMTSSLNWSAGFNIAANHNVLLAYPGLENSPYKNYFAVGEPVIRQQLFSSFLDKKLGIYNANGPNNTTPFHYVGYAPDFTGGIQGRITWKKLSLSLSFTYAKQKGFINIQGANAPGSLGTYGIGNQPVSVLGKHWQSPADSTIGGAFLAAPLAATNLDIYWADASYLSLKNASLNYSLPEKILHKMGMNALSFYINAQNLLTMPLSGYKGVNPEQPGISTQLPLRLILVGGFNITF